MKKVEKEEVQHFQGCSPPISEFEKHRRVFGEKSQSQKNGIASRNSNKKSSLNKENENLKIENELMEKELEKQIENNHKLNREKNWNTNISISRNDYNNDEKDFFSNSADVSVRSSRNFSVLKNSISEGERIISSQKAFSPLSASTQLNIPINNNNGNKQNSKNVNNNTINNSNNNNKTSTENNVSDNNDNIENNYEEIPTKKSYFTDNVNEELGPKNPTSPHTPKSPKSPASRKSPKKAKSPKISPKLRAKSASRISPIKSPVTDNSQYCEKNGNGNIKKNVTPQNATTRNNQNNITPTKLRDHTGNREMENSPNISLRLQETGTESGTQFRILESIATR